MIIFVCFASCFTTTYSVFCWICAEKKNKRKLHFFFLFRVQCASHENRKIEKQKNCLKTVRCFFRRSSEKFHCSAFNFLRCFVCTHRCTTIHRHFACGRDCSAMLVPCTCITMPPRRECLLYYAVTPHIMASMCFSRCIFLGLWKRIMNPQKRHFHHMNANLFHFEMFKNEEKRRKTTEFYEIVFRCSHCISATVWICFFFVLFLLLSCHWKFRPSFHRKASLTIYLRKNKLYNSGEKHSYQSRCSAQ